MPATRTTLVAVGALIAGAVIGGSGYLYFGGAVSAPQQCAGGLTGAAIGGPFALTSHNGEAVSNEDLKGDPLLLYFGYATCPDVCPTELADIGEATRLLETERDIDVQPVFITVDPERDTQQVLTEYVPYFHERMIGLTGKVEDTDAAAKAYRVYYRKAPDEDFPGGYAMDHSSFVYLVAPDGEFITYFKYGATPEEIADGTACHLAKLSS